MPIKVNISLNAGGRFQPVSSHTLHEKRITVGRDPECTLTLEDTQKHVSRTHVEFEEVDGAYWMKVVSKVNPALVNGKRYLSNDRVVLSKGDQISVGLYKLEVAAVDAAPPQPKVEPPKRAPEKPEDITYVARPGMPLPTRSPQPTQPDDTVDREEATFVPPARKPVAEPAVVKAPAATPVQKAPPPISLPPETAAESEEATYVPAAKAAPPRTPATTLPPSAKLPPPHFLPPETEESNEEVTYIQPVATRPPRASPLAPSASDQEEDAFSEDMTAIRRPPVAKIDQLAKVAKVEVFDPPDRVEPSVMPDLDLDLSEAFDTPNEPGPVKKEPVIAKSPARPSLIEPDPDVEEGFSEDLTYVRRPLPRPVPPKAPAPTQVAPPQTARVAPESKPPRPQAGPEADRAVRAFLEGAGLADLHVPDAEKFLRESGAMVRAAVQGVVVLLLAHEEARRQLGAEPEADTVAGENPLKSMADPAEVLGFLFDPQRPAIAAASPVKAFEDACSDLRAHQVALFTGMRAAVIGAMRNLDPKKIEREHGLNVGGLNLTRKSKLWDISVAQYDTLTREMEADFSKVFGQEILAAYTAQMHKMKGGR